MQSDEYTFSTIPEEMFNGYEFDPHSHVVEHDQLKGYFHISTSADNNSSITNDDNIPSIITNVVNDAWEYYKQHRKKHNTDYHDYYCCSYGSSHQNRNVYFPTTRSSVCRTYWHGYLDFTLAEAVYQKGRNSSRVNENHGNWKLPLSLLTTPLRLPILTSLSLISKKLQTPITCRLRKNGQSGTPRLLTTNYVFSNQYKTTHRTTTSRMCQTRKDVPSTLLLSPPDHNLMQLPEKLADLIKVITPSYLPLILWDMCQEWDLCTSNAMPPARRATLFKILKDRRRHLFLLHPLLLIVGTSAKARDTMHQRTR